MSSKSHFFNRRLSLVADYQFNNNLIDDIGGNNGTGTNISYNVGSFGNEVVFNGSNAYVDVADNDVFSFTDGVNDLPFRIELIAKINSNSSQYLISKRVANQFEWQIIFNNGIFQVAISNSISTSLLTANNTINYVSGQYYNIIVTYDGSKRQNGLRIYINGVPNTPNPSNPSYLGMENTNSKISIGRDGRTNSRYLNGAITEIKIYK